MTTRPHPFYVIGSIGMVLTALIHLLVSVLADAFDHAFFFVLYIIFALMMLFGSGKTRRLERVRVRDRF